MKKASVLNYAFAIGKIRVLERFLIKQEVFEEAIESDLNQALRLFAESDLYSDEILHIKDSQDLETVLNQELEQLKRLVGSLLLDKQLLVLLELNNLRCLEDIRKNFPDDFLESYFRQWIDLHNIKTFLRLRILKEPQEKLAQALGCAGFIPREDFSKLYTQDLAVFLLRLEYVHQHNRIVDYAAFLRAGIERAEKENSFVGLEKAMNDFLIRVLRPAKYISFGPQPILAYYFARVNEINLIRMIILAKLNDVSSDLVKERLNSVYA